jgi:RNA polymerase sigma factor (sigma-70 family)
MPGEPGVENPSSLGAAVVAAAQGDETAFARIVATHNDDMTRVAYVICHDTELAHEAVQDAWSIAWRQIGKLREPERLRSWLVAIAANEARQIMRRQRRRTVVELKVEPAELREGSTIWTGSVDLRNALKKLSVEDRQLLALRYVAGIDSFELSRVTGLSPSGTRARLQRILAVLRSELESANG